MILRVKTFDPKKQKNVYCGEYDDITKTYRKSVSFKKHYMHLHAGYGFQMDIVNKLKTAGCEWIQLIVDKVPKCAMFEKLLEGPTGTYKHGKQQFLCAWYLLTKEEWEE